MSNLNRRRLLQAAAAVAGTTIMPASVAALTPSRSPYRMSVNIVRYLSNGSARWGVRRDTGIVPIPDDHASTGDLIQAVALADLRSLDGPKVDPATVTEV